MMVKFTVLFLLTCFLYGNSETRSVESEENSKRFIYDWVSAAASYFAQTITLPVSMIFKAECVTCKCSNACSAEQFTKSIFGLTPSERIVCGMEYWDSIKCSGINKANVTSQPTISNVATTPVPIPTSPGCDKLCSITAVAQSQSQMNPSARKCPKGDLNSNEALPMTCCHINSSNTWQKGAQVMPNCQAIPHYTPVAAFINDILVPGSAGILSSCLTNGEKGFQMLYQDCETKPGLLHISKIHTENNDPDIFYIIH